MAQRFEGSIALANLGFSVGEAGKAASAIVGKGGSGIKELTRKFPGLYIQVYDSRLGRETKTRVTDCDMVYISGRSGADVQGAAKAVAERARAVINGTANPGPSLQVGCPPLAVGAVIGRGGSGLKQIGETAGDYCHIHFNRDTGKFEITANTQVACERAKLYIGQRIRDFLKPKVEKRPESRPRSNGFAGLAVDVEAAPQDDDDMEELVEASRQNMVQVAFDALSQGSKRSKHSIASKTSAEVPQKIRWEIREELSQKVDATGEKLYQPFHRKDRNTGAMQYVSGVQAVPWSAVDDYIAERQGQQHKRQEKWMDQRAQEEQEMKSREQHAAYVATRDSTSAFPTLGSSTKTKVNSWGSKPTSVGSADGVEALNESARKARHPRIQPRKAKASSGPKMVDLSSSLPQAPKRLMVDLTTSVLPNGPKPTTALEMNHAYEEFLRVEDECGWAGHSEAKGSWWDEC